MLEFVVLGELIFFFPMINIDKHKTFRRIALKVKENENILLTYCDFSDVYNLLLEMPHSWRKAIWKRNKLSKSTNSPRGSERLIQALVSSWDQVVTDTLPWKKRKEKKKSRFSISNYGYNFRKSSFLLVSNFPTINSVWKLYISYTLKSDILSMFVYINLCWVLIHSNLQ